MNMWDAIQDGEIGGACAKMNGKPLYQEPRDCFMQFLDQIEEAAEREFGGAVQKTSLHELITAGVRVDLTHHQRLTVESQLPVGRCTPLWERAKREVFATCTARKPYATQSELVKAIGQGTWHSACLSVYDRLMLEELAGIRKGK